MTTQSKEKKRLYDIEYRRLNKEKIRASKQEYNKTSNGRAMQKRARDKQKDYHLSYCRTVEYRDNKKKYDEINLSKKKYGEFWEVMLLVKKINKKVIELVPSKYERTIMRGQVKKAQVKRAFKRHLEKGWNFNY